jgi:hypothetical protein
MSLLQKTDQLRRTIEQLLADQPNDLRLRDHLEGLRRDEVLPGLTWYWGPELYRRNRVVFREFILAHFSQFEATEARGSQRVSWQRHADRLETWLADARQNRDTAMVRRLLGWKFTKGPWEIDEEAWCRELVQAYRAAAGPAAQAVVLEEFETGFQLDEPSALALYRINRACSKFLLTHLPSKYSFWGKHRQIWRQLMDAALEAQDEDLALALYRRQVHLKEWQRDVERLADEIQDPERLNDALRKRHPEGWGLDLGTGAVALLRRRGRDVMPYVREKLDTIIGWGRGSPDAILDLARERGWWDLWTAVVRSGWDPKRFNRAIEELLDDKHLDDATRIERLRALAGVSREWNWPGVGLARVHSLEDEVATRLYLRYPQLVRGPFKPNAVPTWWQGGPQLLAAAQKAGDDDLVDLLASRYLTRARYEGAWFGKEQDAIIQIATDLAASYQSLRDRDAAAFARRAASILTQVPAFAIHGYDHVLRTNDLARLLFVRSFEAFLAVPEAVRDLIEGSEVHVQMLGYHVLAQDDDRAHQSAVDVLEIVLGTLLRPLHRKTRMAAFGALANAARADETAAARVLRRAREALRLPDTRYPKEQLIGLIGAILHAWPALRGPRERPVVFGLKESPG